MKFERLEEEEFRTFLDQHPLKTFLQTPEMARVREKMGFETYYVGVKENDKIIAATMMGRKKAHFGLYLFYAPRGLLVDYENEEVLDFFTKELKKFIKKHKGYFLRIDPYYITEEKDINGKKVEGGITHKKGIMNLKKVGFHHSKEVYQQFHLMFSLLLDKTEEELYDNFHHLTKRMIKKAQENEAIEIREVEEDEIIEVEKLIEETGKRKNFSYRKSDYYKDLYQAFHPRGEIKFMVAELNLVKYQNQKKEMITKLEQELTQIKKEEKRKKYQEKLEKEKQLLEESKMMKTNSKKKVPLSGGVFILYQDELIYLFGGNQKEYMHLASSYLLQWTMIKYAIAHHFKKYNFYGISKPSKEDGVYNFKRGFSGFVEELVGDYELPTHPYYYLDKIIHFIRK